jgi:hypothetical protein
MTTHERELTEPIDLCTPDGARLNPDARGWSRRPLHRANLDGGGAGRNKRWDYWALLAGDLVVSAVYSDIDVLGLADVYWADLSAGVSGGHAIVTAADGSIRLPDVPASVPLVVDRDGLALEIADDHAGTHLRARWTETDGRAGELDVAVALPPDHESLNVVIPWSDEEFNFTSKHQARPATGTLRVGDRHWEIGGAAGDAWGVLDVGRGRWPHDIRWNWGGGAGRTDGHVVGLQFGAKWTAGTGFTENGFVVDGRLHKLGNELRWDYDWDEPMQPWRVVDPGGQLDVVLSPRFDKHGKVEGGPDLGSETHQVFGTWSGRVRTDEGVDIEVAGVQGFAEEARQLW